MTEETAKNFETEASSAPSSRKIKRTPIVIAVVAVVLVVAGIGGWMWHEQPSFCGAVCHDAMGEHVDNYYSQDTSGGAGIASVHEAAHVTCLECHTAELGTQVSELQSYLGGARDVPLTSTYYVDNQTCLNCHGGSYSELAKKTASLGAYNPHANPHGEMNCNECHKGHSAQVDTCGECHDNGGQTMVN